MAATPQEYVPGLQVFSSLLGRPCETQHSDQGTHPSRTSQWPEVSSSSSPTPLDSKPQAHTLAPTVSNVESTLNSPLRSESRGNKLNVTDCGSQHPQHHRDAFLTFVTAHWHSTRCRFVPDTPTHGGQESARSPHCRFRCQSESHASQPRQPPHQSSLRTYGSVSEGSRSVQRADCHTRRTCSSAEHLS